MAERNMSGGESPVGVAGGRRESREIQSKVAGAASAAERQETTDPAVLTFLSGWRQFQHGEIVAGDRLAINYEPTRMAEPGRSGVSGVRLPRRVLGHARFLPGRQTEVASLLDTSGTEPRPPEAIPVPAAAQIAVPTDAEELEVWFEGTDGSATCWDSRFGENYRYRVVRPASLPEPLVRPLAEAVVDPGRVAIVDEAAIKHNALERPSAAPSQGKNMQTSLRLTVSVQGAEPTSRVWADAHVFDTNGRFAHSATLPLEDAGAMDGIAVSSGSAVSCSRDTWPLRAPPRPDRTRGR
jgi:hypothetical protein